VAPGHFQNGLTGLKVHRHPIKVEGCLTHALFTSILKSGKPHFSQAYNDPKLHFELVHFSTNTLAHGKE
jgi:hypothetical protein